MKHWIIDFRSNQMSIPWFIEMSCNWCRALFISRYSLSFSAISSSTYFSRLLIFIKFMSSYFLSWDSRSFCSWIIMRFYAISDSFKDTVFSKCKACWSDSRSRSFMSVMWASRSAKFSVKWTTFSWRDLSLASVLQSWTSRELMVLDFSASMSRRTWISISMSFFCLSTSSKIVWSRLELNYYRANF